MKRKLVFFDIDGTLLPFGGAVPEDTRGALRQLMAAGHIPVVCTGRTRPAAALVKPVMELGFPARVLAAGCEIEYQGKTVWSRLLDRERIAWTCRLLDEVGCGQCLEGPDYMCVPEQWWEEIYPVWSDFLGSEEVFRPFDMEKHPIQKLMAFHSERLHGTPQEAELREYYQLLYYDFGGVVELVPREVSKATGIQRFLELLNMEVEDTLAFGDGPNDVEMLRFVHCGIAMGNAQQEALEAADYVTAHCEEGGIAKALKHFGLI